jgi:hypothetical protein
MTAFRLALVQPLTVPPPGDAANVAAAVGIEAPYSDRGGMPDVRRPALG